MKSHWSWFSAVLVLVVIAAMACGGGGSQGAGVKTYTHPRSGMSFDYPASWQFEEINENEVAVGPKSDRYGDQVQFSVSFDQPALPRIGPQRFVAVVEASLSQTFALDKDCRNFQMVLNEPGSGGWTWRAMFAVICQDKPLQGVLLVLETSMANYTVTLLQASLDFPEGMQVVNSLRTR